MAYYWAQGGPQCHGQGQTYQRPTELTNLTLLAAILKRAKSELFSEWGHRWFGPYSTNNINSVMEARGNVTQLKGGAGMQ